MKFAFCLEMLYDDLPFKNRLAVAKKAGIDSIEFWDWRNKDLDDLKKQLLNLGMQVSNISGNRTFGMIDADERENFMSEVRETSAIAKQIGCPTLMLLVQKLEEPNNAGKLPSKPLSENEIEETIITCGVEVGKMADELDLNFVIEPLNDAMDHPHYVLKTTAMAIRIIEAINHPRVKLLYDIYHMAMQNEDIYADIENELHHIGYFHIADKPGRNEPGTGTINYAEILSILKKKKFAGTVGFEFLPKHDTQSALRTAFKLIS